MKNIKEVKAIYKADISSAKREYKEKKMQIRKEHLKEMLEDDACKYLTGAIKYVFRHELSQL